MDIPLHAAPAGLKTDVIERCDLPDTTSHRGCTFLSYHPLGGSFFITKKVY